ncbi:MAG: ring-cleaving dioxygenase [Bacteroidetes bacterium]|nr:MAG: ring-cleaving dioxygenase [Bacteroidota bacterium]
MPSDLINGLHHVTAIAGSVRNNVRFYTEILGLRFIKKTINYDSPETWHLYYGDETGSPGSAITFFPFRGITRGRSGNRSMTTTMFSIGENSIDFWKNRLKTHQIEFRGPHKRFNEEFLIFEDFDGMPIELVANAEDTRTGRETPGIPSEHAIKGFYSVLLSYASFDPSLDFLLKFMNHKIVENNGDRVRLYSGSKVPGYYVDLISHPSSPNQTPGAGTVHHLAFQTDDEESQKKIRTILQNEGYFPSSVMDRQYFRSIYFREPGGVLFEVATSGPGFLVDEDIESLGSSLKLPHWLESQRKEIENMLEPID